MIAPQQSTTDSTQPQLTLGALLLIAPAVNPQRIGRPRVEPQPAPRRHALRCEYFAVRDRNA